MKTSPQCVRCEQPKRAHYDVYHFLMSNPRPCHRFTSPAPKWLRLLTWITGKAARL